MEDLETSADEDDFPEVLPSEDGVLDWGTSFVMFCIVFQFLCPAVSS